MKIRQSSNIFFHNQNLQFFNWFPCKMDHMKRGNLFIGFSFIGLRKRSDYIFRKLEYILTFWGHKILFPDGQVFFFFILNIVKIQFCIYRARSKNRRFSYTLGKIWDSGGKQELLVLWRWSKYFFHSNIV